MRLSKKYIDMRLKIYSCNADKNSEYNKKNCAIMQRKCH